MSFGGMNPGSAASGVLGIGTSIAQGITGGKASKKAARLMAEEEDKNRQLYENMVNQYTNDVNPYTTAGSNATTAMQNLLGLNGADASGQQAQAFKNFQNSDGYQYTLNNALGSTNSNAYASGLGNSGATMKALQNNASDLADTYFNNYYNDLSGLSSQGLNATQSLGQVMAEGANGEAKANTAQGEDESAGVLGSHSALWNGVNQALSYMSQIGGEGDAAAKAAGSSYDSAAKYDSQF